MNPKQNSKMPGPGSSTAAAPDDFHWLVSDAGKRWLAEASTQQLTPSFLKQLRKSVGSTRAGLVGEQVRLRLRAAAKFSAADKLFFTTKSLEQSTDSHIARYKASRFRVDRPLVDCCCGIGGDLLELAARTLTGDSHSTATGLDLDEVTSILAQANLNALDLPGVVKQVDAANFELPPNSQWHMDPDRRSQGRRVTRVDDYQPTVAEIDRWRAEAADGVVKLAPATTPPDHWLADAEVEFIESRNECRQQLVWWGSLARHPGHRVATVIVDDAAHSLVESTTAEVSDTDSVDQYVLAPRAAVLAAKLVDTLGEHCNAACLSRTSAYLTCSEPVVSPWAQTFRVLSSQPFDRKRVRRLLREHEVGMLEVKQRGTPLDANQLQRQLSQKTGRPAVLILYKRQQRVISILAERLPT